MSDDYKQFDTALRNFLTVVAGELGLFKLLDWLALKMQTKF